MTPPKPVPSARIIRELRANDWSWAGIAGIYDITEAAVRMISRGKDCQLPCDADCEIGPVHCRNYHRPSHKPDWHDPAECDVALTWSAACPCGWTSGPFPDRGGVSDAVRDHRLHDCPSRTVTGEVMF